MPQSPAVTADTATDTPARRVLKAIADAAYWSEQETARYLGLAAITLKVRRRKGKPLLPYYRFARRVMYSAAEVRAWAEAQRCAA